MEQSSVVSVNNSKLKSTILLPEILTIIFSYLDVADKFRASQVCKTWNTIFKSKLFWRGATVGLHINTNFSQQICQLFKQRDITRFQVLSLKAPNCLTEFVNNMPNITSLCLEGCIQLNDDNLITCFSNNLPHITELNLSLCYKITDIGIEHITNTMTGLTKLEISCCRLIKSNGYLSIAQNLKNLTHLSLELCLNLSIVELGHICGVSDESNGGLPLLTFLAIDLCMKIDDTGILYIANNLRHLRVFTMSFCFCVSSLGISYLSSITSLKELNISYSLITDGALKQLSRLKSLESLNVSSTKITDVGLEYILEGCPNLKKLVITNCKRVRDLSVYKQIMRDPGVPNFRASYNVSGTVN